MNPIADAMALILAAIGALLMLVAGIGIVRLPDLLTRMHASSKAGTLGAVCIMAAVGLHFHEFAVIVKIVLIILFLFLTAPVAAHVIGRAGYRSGVRLSDETVLDEYRAENDGA